MSAPAEAVLDAPVIEVTVLEDRARVTRRGKASLATGWARVVVRGVAPVLVDKTLTAVVTGRARVLDVRCRRRLATWRAGEPVPAGEASERGVEVTSLERELFDLELAMRAQTAGVEGLDRELADLATLRKVALTELADAAAWGVPPIDAAARLAALDAAERALTERRHGAHETLTERHAAHARLERRVAQVQVEAGVATAELLVDLEVEAAGEVELSLEYLVPGAVWRPYHAATLARGEVTVATDACVWQSTGEDWRGVTLSLSTERPSLGASPPTLSSDELRVQKKRDAVEVEAREQDIEETSLGQPRAQTTAAEVPGVDDGGVAQLLRAPHPATIPADGRPWRVALRSFAAPAEVTLVAMPERAPLAILRTRQANGDGPLLAGPVDLVRDAGSAGRTSVLYVAAGERFELGWGPDPDVRLHREEHRKRDEAGLLGSWHTTRVRVAVRVSNLGALPKVVEVVERVPVSELEKVEIVVAPEGGWQLEDDDGHRPDDAPLATGRTVDRDGLVRWRVELPAHGRRAIALEYRIRSHTSVVGI